MSEDKIIKFIGIFHNYRTTIDGGAVISFAVPDSQQKQINAILALRNKDGTNLAIGVLPLKNVEVLQTDPVSDCLSEG